MKEKVLHFKPITTSYNESSILNHDMDDVLKDEMKLVEEELKRVISGAPSSLKQTIYRLAYLNSDRICPALYLLSARIFQQNNKKPESHTQLAASMEALNMALSAHENHRKSSDLLGGDYLFSVALSLACQLPQAVKGMTEVITRYVEGEFIEPLSVFISSNSNLKKWYFKRLSNKEASLLSLSSSLGCWASGGDQVQIKKMAYFAHYLGMGRQLKRDLYHFENSFEKNLKNGNFKVDFCLPVIHVLEISSYKESFQRALECSFVSKKVCDLWKQEIERIGYKDYMVSLIQKNYQEAFKIVNNINSISAKDKNIIDMLLKEIDINYCDC